MATAEACGRRPGLQVDDVRVRVMVSDPRIPDYGGSTQDSEVNEHSQVKVSYLRLVYVRVLYRVLGRYG